MDARIFESLRTVSILFAWAGVILFFKAFTIISVSRSVKVIPLAFALAEAFKKNGTRLSWETDWDNAVDQFDFFR